MKFESRNYEVTPFLERRLKTHRKVGSNPDDELRKIFGDHKHGVWGITDTRTAAWNIINIAKGEGIVSSCHPIYKAIIVIAETDMSEPAETRTTYLIDAVERDDSIFVKFMGKVTRGIDMILFGKE